ncbi:MAG: hypothetical protein ACJ77K_04315 [Bacteroidia bacterium]|jgi:hypothetical protein
METQTETEKAVDQIYEYAANLMVKQSKTPTETINLLVSRGLDQKSATTIVTNLEQHIGKAKKERANKDMLYGALWCIGGIIATVSDIGFIFWGAIVFGAVQFFKGVINANS